jgi:hypothetical protein
MVELAKVRREADSVRAQPIPVYVKAARQRARDDLFRYRRRDRRLIDVPSKLMTSTILRRPRRGRHDRVEMPAKRVWASVAGPASSPAASEPRGEIDP